MHRAASQQRAAFLTSLQKQLTTILGMLPGMSHEQQKTTLQLLYFAKTLRKTHFHVLVNWVRSEATDMTLVKYLLSLLNGRLAKQLTSGEVWTEPSAYISYTISLLVGGSVPKMAEQQFPTMALLSPHVYAPEIDGGSLDGWPRQKDVVLAVHDSIHLLPNSQQVEDLYFGHVEQILVGGKSAPVLSFLAAMLLAALRPERADVARRRPDWAELCYHIMLSLVAAQTTTTGALECAWDTCVQFCKAYRMGGTILDSIAAGIQAGSAETGTLVTLATKLMRQACDSRDSIQQPMSAIRTAAESQLSEEDVKTVQWWADFMYELTLHCQQQQQ
ncbi:PREDICTED: uncharacterized protein LOC106808468 [Priapulus caudatus]|uniref:Uncharacterized protein LOC106808468 n=1 Tax=Priapulus caudatus TaxID=37621 RepID=A0ABM1E3C0_PRICU|nr:PREDICTED: uncharacterized protein LOC106808468 [Priapulus caudatus]